MENTGMDMGPSKGEYFHMRVALMTTVHDYLGYGYTSGQVCH